MKKIICLIASIGLMFLNMSAYAGTVAWATGDRGSGAYEAYVITDEGLKVGNGTPTVTMNGEDAYIEGTLEVDGASTLDGNVTSTGILRGSSIGVTSLFAIATTTPTFVGQVVMGTDYLMYSGSQTATCNWSKIGAQ